jgi:hypothetical protein
MGASGLAIECLLILAAAAAAVACTYEGACSSQDRAGPGDARDQRDQGKQVYERRIVGRQDGYVAGMQRAERAGRAERAPACQGGNKLSALGGMQVRRRQDAGKTQAGRKERRAQAGRSRWAQAGAGWAHTGSGRSSDE